MFRTFADGESTRRSRSSRGTREVRTPTGKIHASLDAVATLCGISVLELAEFGRSRLQGPPYVYAILTDPRVRESR